MSTKTSHFNLTLCIPFFLILFGISKSLPAQEGTTPAWRFGASGILRAQQADFSAFNRQATDLGFSALGEVIPEMRVSYFVKKGDFFKGLDVGFTPAVAPAVGTDGRTTAYSHFNVRLNTAFSLLPKESPWSAGPTFSVMAQLSRVVLSERSAVYNLGQAASAEYTRLTRFGIPMDAGLFTSRRIRLFKHSDLSLGLGGGYRFDNDRGWRVNDAVAFNNPGLRVRGWYGELSFGLLSR